MENEVKKPNLGVKIAVFVITAVVVFSVMMVVLNADKILEVLNGNNLESELTTMTNELNSSTPMMVDQVTRLDNALVKNGDTVVYNYTIIGYSYEELVVLFDEATKETQKTTLVNAAKTNPDLEYFRENKVNLEYSYRAEDGQHLFAIEIPSELFV